ncbi:MAG: YkoF family thiamine/hydroxymethylpyrimidine-binding protein [Flavobacteriaceae bacterium]|jgi:uncharacterized protein YqgV (UPF0045/DUF77 family)|nr:YkoF family thiamine/hydroxymethylpyrimidine-binding protein [Flavobacteriaceae bacterium]MDG2315203.1 YkoF family thiamine/hydroxymethylpyrimidine-binding protein [Flavobacteriaceae bacterium]
MDISVELTLTPLQDQYEAPIINFIKELRASGCRVQETPLSTQIYGDFNTVMSFVNRATQKAFEHSEHIILHMKIVKSNRSDYEPFF